MNPNAKKKSLSGCIAAAGVDHNHGIKKKHAYDSSRCVHGVFWKHPRTSSQHASAENMRLVYF